MNRIVREHYPASKLPKDLQEGMDATGRVTVTVVQEQEPASAEELIQLLHQARERAQAVGGVTSEEAVARVRELRDE